MTHALEETSSDIYCPNITQSIKRGYRDANTNGSVSELQQFLSDYYDIEPTQIITGFFGNITRGYVVRFQTERNFPSDSRTGIVGTMTRGQIAQVCTDNPSQRYATTSPTALLCPTLPIPSCSGTLTPTLINGCPFYVCSNATPAASYAQGSYSPAYSQASYYAQASYETTVTPPTNASCSFNSQPIAHGGTVTAYQSASVANGSQCVSETRSCTNGTLSGTYDQSTCTVAAPVAIATCPQLQQALFQKEAAGGGEIQITKNITCSIVSDTYKGSQTRHALIIPENVTLDLNDQVIVLTLQGQGYGVRLTRNSTLKNGHVVVASSVDPGGSQAIWHSAISVGPAFGEGGSVANPSYFSRISNWRIENISVDQPFARSAIQFMGEASNGVVKGVHIKSSGEALVGLSMDAGTLGELTFADSTYPAMKILFGRGEVKTTHPHHILIDDFRVDALTKNTNDDFSSAIRLSGAHSITISPDHAPV